MKTKALCLQLLIISSFFFVFSSLVSAQTALSPTLSLQDSAADDVDDAAIWIHPTDSSKSVIIGSDKYGDQLFVYDLNGNTIQRVTGLAQPGNIDLYYNFPLNGSNIDVIGVNERNTSKLVLYKLDPSTRQLTRIDDGNINTVSSNYGFCFYKSPTSGKAYAFTPHENGVVEQFELFGNGSKISGTEVRTWDVGGQTEGCVADHTNKVVYVGEEDKAVWKYGAEPSDSTTNRTQVAVNGQNGLKSDIEGVTIYYAGSGGGYLLVSSQGNSSFKIYDRQAPHTYRGDFKVSGASSTDGIDVNNFNFGSKFPQGMFIAHSGSSALKVVPWQSIANLNSLTIDTTFNPRTLFGGPIPTSSPNPTPTSTPTPKPTPTPTTSPAPGGTIPTEANLKVAIIGDTGYTSNFRSVLQLIKSEGADLVLHQGDFDYKYDADGFFDFVNAELGSTFPYLGSVGNHDVSSWNTGCSDSDGCYADFFKQRMQSMGVSPDNSDLNDQMYSTTFKGLKMVFVGQNGASTGDNTYAPYIQNQLQNDNHIWKICSWHKNQKALQVGGKSDEMGWNVYDNCMNLGAIIATAHEHSYQRTKTLTSMRNQTVDPACSDPNSVCVAPGKSFVLVSGLSGNSIRNQDRCLPTTYPYGCNGEWASIYTSDQSAKYGALFLEFNVDGNPYKARGYFKNISGQIIDQFTINKASVGGPVPSQTPTPQPSNSPTPQPTNNPTPQPTYSPNPTPSGTCSVGDSSWQSYQIPNSPVTSITFSATPNANNMDGVIGFGQVSATTYSDLAAIVRFNPDGFIDARNGEAYVADASVPYVAGNAYNFSLQFNLSSGTYNVTVTPAGGQAVTLASNYQFRSEQSGTSQITTFSVHTGDTNTYSICDLGSSSGGGTGGPTVTGPADYLQTYTGTSTASDLVTTSGDVTDSGNLFLATVTSRSSSTIQSVSGLGLNWTRLVNQCSARNATGLDIWVAQGTPNSSAPVQAQLSASVDAAALAVSAFRKAGNVETVVALNTLGIDGACSGGTDSSTYSTPISVGANQVLYTAVATRHYDHQGPLEVVADVKAGSGGSVAGLSISTTSVDTANTYNLSGTLSGTVDWTLAAITITGTGSGPVSPNSCQQADITNDGIVDLSDFSILASNFLSRGSHPADINSDGIVDLSDFSILASNFLARCNPVTSPTPTPILTTPTPTPTGSPTPTPTVKPSTIPTPVPPTPTPTPTVPPSIPPIGQTQGIWLSKEEIMALPTSGSAWNAVLSAANSSWGSANLGDNNASHDVKTLAGALVAVRNNDSAMRSKVISGLQSAMSSGTSRTLELARGLQTYVISADLIGYRTTQFEAWVKKMLEDTSISGRIGGGLYVNAIKDPTNWGGHERASSIAAAMYLGDNSKLTELARVHREFNGENVSPKTLKYDNTNWHADPNNKAGVNRKGSTIQGRDVSGVLPEDWRRGGEFKWPPSPTGYMWEGMQGYVVSAVMLHRAGIVHASSGDNAVARAMDILYKIGNTPGSDDAWLPYLVNKYWGTNFSEPSSTSPGKGMGYTDWTHQ